MKLKYTLLFLFWATVIFAQNPQNSKTSSIKGVVIEESSGRTSPGVNVIIKGTKLGTITDVEGNFIFRNLEAGKYDLQFSTLGFDTKVVTEVEVQKNETTNMTVSIVEKNNTLKEVIITTTKMKTESVKSLLTMQKNSVRVSDGISAESIKRTPDRTTSDVLKRISGASIQDNKFVIIRGLNDRYNASFLNGAPLPSSEPDRKAFSFDIFPSNMIDNLVIYKTASPDLPGEFAGGVIDITTKAVADKDFQSISIGAGYNTITTGKKQVYAPEGKKDWIGLDDGTRSIPASIPNTEDYLALQKLRVEASILSIDYISKNSITDWNLYQKNFSPNRNFQFTLGRTFKSESGKTFGFVTSISNAATNNYNQTTLKKFDSPNSALQSLSAEKYATQILSAAIANFSLKLNANNNFNFKNLYSINSERSVLERKGTIDREDPQGGVYSNARLFTSNAIFTSQLGGEHFFTKSKLKISWNQSYSNVTRLTPNDKRNNYSYVLDSSGKPGPYNGIFLVNSVGDETSGNTFSAKNKEAVNSSKIDLSRKFKFTDKIGVEIKAGLYTQSRVRTYDARQMGYTKFFGRVNKVNYGDATFDNNIGTQNETSIFGAANMGIIDPINKVSGLTLYDATKPYDSYNANSSLNASYIMFDNSFGKFRFVWGARIENYSQDLVSKFDNGNPAIVHNNQVDYLPSGNLIFGVNSKQNIRLSYSKTLNRPEFRELAPLLFFDFTTREAIVGNTNLKIATIENYDFRYEFFPGKNQLLTASIFYKKFLNPIELQLTPNDAYQYQNAKSGENKGVELEFRTLLSTIAGTEDVKFLDDLTIFSNLAIIRSKVDVSNLVQSTTYEDIPLQGQSPFVFNAGVQYLNEKLGFSYSANINKVGDRITVQGSQIQNAATSALWEKGRNFIDMQFAKSFLDKKLELKLNIQNILAQDLIFYENNDIPNAPNRVAGFNSLVNDIFTGSKQNRNGYDSATDDVVRQTKFGRTFSLTVSYNF